MSVLARLLDRAGTGPTLEPMRPRHIGQIMDMERAAYPKPWSTKVFHDELEQARSGHRRYIVARSGRQIVGYAGLMFAADEAHVTNIVVHADHRRDGVGTRLLSDLARAAIDRGCVAWTLEVRASSTGAQELYRRFGFVPAGVRARYYEGTEDAIVMWCHDLQSPAYTARLRELAR
jgi:[ribosomal protein S18]-alanine N-acetyltransferase